MHVKKSREDVVGKVSLTLWQFFIDDDWNIIVDDDVFPNILLGHMNFHEVNPLLADLLALQHAFQKAVFLSNQVECPW
jgi:hypothetical protein